MNGHPLPCPFVERLTLIFNGGIGRRNLLPLTHHKTQRLIYIFPADTWSLFRNYFAFHIVGVCFHAKQHGGSIFLFIGAEKLGKFGAFVYTHGKNAGGQRIQRARMSRFFEPQGPFYIHHHIVRCLPRGLVYDNDAVHIAEPRASITCRFTLSSFPLIMQAAAFICPPPPRRRATCSTLVFPLERRLSLLREQGCGGQ